MNTTGRDMLGVAASRLAGIVAGRGLWLSTAESCTGGLVAAALTDIPGSSAWFRGGVISYHNLVKTNILGVPESIIDACGAVSAECVEAMARGAAQVCVSELAMAVSGIAGPAGGTAEKPVGLVFSAVFVSGSVMVFRDIFNGDRKSVRLQAASAVMERLVGMLG